MLQESDRCLRTRQLLLKEIFQYHLLIVYHFEYVFKYVIRSVRFREEVQPQATPLLSLCIGSTK